MMRVAEDLLHVASASHGTPFLTRSWRWVASTQASRAPGPRHWGRLCDCGFAREQLRNVSLGLVCVCVPCQAHSAHRDPSEGQTRRSNFASRKLPVQRRPPEGRVNTASQFWPLERVAHLMLTRMVGQLDKSDMRYACRALKIPTFSLSLT